MAVKKKTAEQTAEDTAQAAAMAQEPPQQAQEGQEKAETGENTKEPEKAQEEAQGGQEEPEELLVYVGPSLPRGKLKQNSIFRGTRKQVEKNLEEVIKQYPLVGKMLVPTSKLAEAKIKIASSGNIFHKYYADIVSLISAEMEG